MSERWRLPFGILWALFGARKPGRSYFRAVAVLATVAFLSAISPTKANAYELNLIDTTTVFEGRAYFSAYFYGYWYDYAPFSGNIEFGSENMPTNYRPEHTDCSCSFVSGQNAAGYPMLDAVYTYHYYPDVWVDYERFYAEMWWGIYIPEFTGPTDCQACNACQGADYGDWYYEYYDYIGAWLWNYRDY